MALQALSTYSQRSFNPNLDLTVELRVDSSTSVNEFLHTFVVNNWNAVVLQMRELPSVPREVELIARGNGSAVAKVGYRNIDRNGFLVQCDDFLHCLQYLKSYVQISSPFRTFHSDILNCKKK